ncbi:MAG: glycosyltransferase [Deltaproteobacteria bacterium]
MRILISVQNYHPAYSFGGRVVKSTAVAEGLAKLGHEVSVVTSSVIDRETKPAFFTRRESVNGVSVIYLGTWLRFSQISLNPSALRFALSEVKKYDAVYIVGLYDAISPLVALAARRARIPYIVEPSGMLIPIVRSLRLKRAYHKIIGSWMLRDAHAVFYTSQIEHDEAVGFGIAPEKLLLSPNGINLGDYKSLPTRGAFRRCYEIPEGSSLVLSLGRIEQKKNLEELFRAVAGLRSLDFFLAVVGPSESEGYLNKLKRLASELQIEPRVRFIPTLLGEEKLSAYVDADIFAIVSINENWGITATEAIACGLPVVVTDTCGVAEVVEGRAGLVVKRDAASIREGIEKLSADDGLRAEIKARLPEVAGGLSWDSKVSQLARIFSFLIAMPD